MVLLALFIVTISFSFSLLLLQNIKNDRSNLFFFLTSLFLSIWILSHYPSVSTSKMRLALVCSSLYPITTLLFVLEYPKKLIQLSKLRIAAIALISFVSIYFCNTEYVFVRIENQSLVTGPFYEWWSAGFITVWLLILGIVLYGIFTYDKKSSKQLKCFLLGLFTALFLAVSSNLILPALGVSTYLQLGPLFATIFILTNVYTILKYQFVDISVFVNRSLAHGLALFLYAGLYVALHLLCQFFMPGYEQLGIQLYSIVFLIATLPTYNRMRLKLQSTTEKLFLKNRYDYKEVVLSFSSSDNFSFTMSDLEKKISSLFLDELELSPVQIFFPEGFDTQKGLSSKFLVLSSPDKVLPIESKEEIDKQEGVVFPIKNCPSLSGYSHHKVLIKCVDKEKQLIGLLFIGPKLSEDPFYHEDYKLFETISYQVSVFLTQIKQLRVSAQVEMAHNIQNEIIPSAIELPNCNVLSFFQASEEVGGDYYDYFKQDEHHIVVLGDVSGHGVGSGLVMFMVQSIFSTLIRESKLTSPAQINQAANKVLCANFERLSEPRPMTLATCYTKDGKRFACHGSHESVFVYRKKSQAVETAALTDIPLGIGLFDDLDDELFVDNEIVLESGDVLILCTDGIIEAENDSKEEFGEQRLLQIITSTVDQGVESVKETLINAVNQHSAGVQLDDMSLILIEAK